MSTTPPVRASIRDIESVPYRWTERYRRAAAKAAEQKGRMHHTVHQLWASESGQSTSGMLRRPAGATSR